MAGIDKTIETFSDIGNIAEDLIVIVKAGGFKLILLPKVMSLMNSVGELIKDAPAALPELMDLDAAESAKIGAAAYDLVKKVMKAIA